MNKQTQPLPNTTPAVPPPAPATSSPVPAVPPAVAAVTFSDPAQTNIGERFMELVAKKKKAGLPARDSVAVTVRQLRADASRGLLDKDAVEQWLAASSSQIARAEMGV